MNAKPISFKTISMIMLLSLALSVLGGIPARAAQTSPEAAPPTGLSANDWAQIQALLSASLPSQQAYLKASNTEGYDDFGHSVAISGNTVVVGAYYEDSSATGVNGDQNNNSVVDSGAAYVFVRSGTTWSQQAYLKASNTGADDEFGWSVAISGDTVVVGAPYEDSNATGMNGNQSDNTATDSGAAYVFTRSGTTWNQQAYLKASNTETEDYFGTSVAIDGDTVVIGAPYEDSNAFGVSGNQNDNSALNAGAAYVFTCSGTTWSQQAYLKASNTGEWDVFGASVSISGDMVVIGAPWEDSNATGVNGDQNNDLAIYSGAAYVFTRGGGTTWSQQAYLKASNTEAYDYFGYSVAISGLTVVAGAYAESSNATGVDGNQNDNSDLNSGAAYVFTLQISTTPTWSQQAYLKASNTEGGDEFGREVAISGDTVVIGAYFEDSSASGVNGNQNDNSDNNSGAAYVFTRSGVTWSQQAYLKASNPGPDDYFGYSVAASGDAVVVGAVYEDSSATGVNGNQTDNSATNSGAAYFYEQTYNTTFTSVGTYDGHILESGENTTAGGTLDSTSPTFYLGDDTSDKQYRAVLSFDTSALPNNAVITRVILKLRKQGQQGADPFTILGGLKVDIRKPYFGTTLGLVVSDFQAAAGLSNVSTFKSIPKNNWYFAVIGSAGYSQISLNGTTQFRLRFLTDDNNNNVADYMKFFTGDYSNTAARPTLVITYYVP